MYVNISQLTLRELVFSQRTEDARLPLRVTNLKIKKNEIM
jgi:hypothetical protein